MAQPLMTSCGKPDAPEQITTTIDGSGPDCRSVTVLGQGASIHCTFPYSYRSSAALRDFNELDGFLRDCSGSAPDVDAPVNHPDSYVQHSYVFGDGIISLSLKDKQALGQTLLFVRAAQNGTN